MVLLERRAFCVSASPDSCLSPGASLFPLSWCVERRLQSRGEPAGGPVLTNTGTARRLALGSGLPRGPWPPRSVSSFVH